MSIRVAFDATVAQLGRAGPAVYITSLRGALEPLLGDRLEILASRWAAPRGARRTLGDRARTVARDLWWHQAGVIRAARRAGCGLLHLPAGLGPVRSAFPIVVTVHDLIVRRFPQLFPLWHRTYTRAVLPRLALAARRVIAVSEATKRDLVELVGVPEERVVVIPNGVHPAMAPVLADSARARDVRRRYGLPERFALTVGAIEPRKNLTRLFDAAARVRARPEARDLVLMHAGPAGWLAPDVARAAGGHVRFLGYVPPEDLATLYGLARCCAYPSLWEGFGLPVVEAMACGCPVLTSGVSAMPEVAGDAALLVDPTSTDEIAATLARLWTDDALRASLARRGLQRAREFSWERAARETVAVYDAALA